MPLYSSDTGIGQSIETTPRFGSGHRQQDILNQKFSPPAVSDLSYSQPDSSNEPEQSSGPIFLLVPTNPAARKATENVLNSYYQWREDDGNVLGLWIDLSNPSHSTITLGRTDTNIHLPDTWSNTKGSSPHISSLHASFEVIPETGAVLLWDHSKDANVEPFAPNHLSGHSWTVKFRSSARRSVIVARGINSHVAFGKDKWYQFEIQWQSEAMYGFSKGEPYQMGPRQARTKRYVQLDKLGGGVYGTVYSALDATTGLLIAVKRFHNLIGKVLTFATREVANLRIRELRQHPHILRILDSAGGGEKDNWGEIFMPLQKGNLKDLVGMMGDESQKWTLSEVVLRQMLSALECLEAHHIIHRDVKPDNILWEYDENGNYIFCLGDFGLSNDPKVATTTAGTAPFMAPEVFNRQKHTTKIDIWSLYATIVWMRSRDFRAMCSSITAQELHHQLTKISKLPDYSNIRGMGAWNPRQRPSPSQQLYILDHGDYNFVETDGYAPVEQANPVEDDSDLANQFVQNISLGGSSGPSLTYGSGSSEHPASPEVPYYEPYAPQIYFPQRGKGGMQQHRAEKGDGRFHQPLPHSTEISPEDQAAWVAEYNTNIYGTLENQDTAVPATMATAIPMGTAKGDYEYEYYLEERRQKGKKRNYR
ncbi:kinase-like domain-containing protein [Podospora fimiseda]|uniref:non-specific serine/threonine protein kinase n=1 Tax=Podospora fimiseda TaxID=252190 RepID=A0AAN6YMQ5_9PEZI|nr:kinase-like domain-containing protein [Podospora fimiseda]